MKTFKKLFVLLLTVVLIGVMSIPCFALGAPAASEAKAGDVVTVSFSYEDIAGIRGTFSFSKADLIKDINIETNAGFEGSFNKENGILVYFASEPADFVCTAKITLADTAVVGDEIKITLEYETTVDGNMPSVPVYSYDYVTIKIGIDYSKLNQQIALAQAIDKNDYTEESVKTLEDALTKAIAAKTSTEQATVDAAADALEKAIKGLVKKIDYSKLEAQITKAEALNKNEYTENSWKNLEDALTKAKEARTAKEQATVDAAADALEKAINALEKKAIDYSKLNEQIAIAQKIKKGNYTDQSWKALEDALAKAIAARTSTEQAVVDDATAKLKAAIAGLQTKPGVTVDINYDELNEQIDIAQKLNKDEYTEDSWKNLEDALANAVEARSLKVQAAVDAAADALENAIKALVKKSVPGKIDYTKLNEQIEIAQGLNKDAYVEESWAVLESALEEAIEARNATTQAEVDAATEKLKNAIASLEEKSTGLAWGWIIFLIVLIVVAIIIFIILYKRKSDKEKAQ